MATELTTLETLNERIKNKIKEDFVSLLPDELFEQLVAKTSKEFFEREMPEMIKASLREKLQERLTYEFKKEEWQTVWTSNSYGGGSQRPGEMLQRVIRESAPVLMEALVQGMILNVVQTIQHRKY